MPSFDLTTLNVRDLLDRLAFKQVTSGGYTVEINPDSGKQALTGFYLRFSDGTILEVANEEGEVPHNINASFQISGE